MKYPYKYPELYAELARQGKTKGGLAASLGISTAGLRYKQLVGDFSIAEMNRAAAYLDTPAEILFADAVPRAG